MRLGVISEGGAGGEESAMSFCEHCEGQRFDRAQVLRALRRTREGLRKQEDGRSADEAVALAIRMVRALDIPHIELAEEPVIH